MKNSFRTPDKARESCGRSYPKGDLVKINTVKKTLAIKELIISVYGSGKIS